MTAQESLRELARLVRTAGAVVVGQTMQRRPHPDDRRKNLVELTGAGHDTRRRATQASEDAERRFLAALDGDDAKRLKQALRALISATARR